MAEPSSGAHIDDPGGMKDATQHVAGHLDAETKRSYAATSKANHAAHGLAAQVNAELRKAVRVPAKDGDYGTEFYDSIAGNPDLCKAYFDCLHRLLKTSRDWENAVSWWLKENEVVRQAFKLYLKQRPSKKGREPGSKTRWDGSTRNEVLHTRNTGDNQRQAKACSEQEVVFDPALGPEYVEAVVQLQVLSKISALSHVKSAYVAIACSDDSGLNRNDRERVFKAIETVLLDGGTSAAKQAEVVKVCKGHWQNRHNWQRKKHRAYIEKSSTLSNEDKQRLLKLLF